MISHSLKNIFDSWGFTYDFAFCQNKWSLKICQNVSQNMSFKNNKIYHFSWGLLQNNSKKDRLREKSPNFYFMFFDRYEIHIQAFANVFIENLSFFDHHLQQNILRNLYSNCFSNKKWETQNYLSKETWWVCLSKKRTFSNFQIIRYEK